MCCNELGKNGGLSTQLSGGRTRRGLTVLIKSLSLVERLDCRCGDRKSRSCSVSDHRPALSEQLPLDLRVWLIVISAAEDGRES